MPVIVSAFIELLREILDYVVCVTKTFLAGLRDATLSIFSLFSGAFGLWLANISTVIGTIIAVAQVNIFSQLPEIALYICANRFGKEIPTLMSYRDKTVFLNLNFNRDCPFDLDPEMDPIVLFRTNSFTSLQYKQVVGTLYKKDGILIGNSDLRVVIAYQIIIVTQPSGVDLERSDIFQWENPYIIRMDSEVVPVIRTVFPLG